MLVLREEVGEEFLNCDLFLRNSKCGRVCSFSQPTEAITKLAWGIFLHIL